MWERTFQSKLPQEEAARLNGMLSFPLWDFGEVTGKVSGTRGHKKEVSRQLETLQSGPRLPNDFQAIGAPECTPQRASTSEAQPVHRGREDETEQTTNAGNVKTEPRETQGTRLIAKSLTWTHVMLLEYRASVLQGDWCVG